VVEVIGRTVDVGTKVNPAICTQPSILPLLTFSWLSLIPVNAERLLVPLFGDASLHLNDIIRHCHKRVLSITDVTQSHAVMSQFHRVEQFMLMSPWESLQTGMALTVKPSKILLVDGKQKSQIRSKIHSCHPL
jgi:hypothetical protein